jgi:tripartite-type tricarboxylate transporter receptor subunit TctC
MNLRAAFRPVTVFTLWILFPGTAAAQSWPSRPLRYIVPFPPGAFNDTLARTPEHFSSFLKREVERRARVVREANIKAD